MSHETTPSHSDGRSSSALGVRPANRQAVAITGASSFLGTNLVGMLEQDESVRRIVCLDLKAPRTAAGKSRAYELDLTNPTAEERLTEIFSAEGVDTVVHLAFLSSPTHTSAWAHELESVGTMQALNACRRSTVRKFVVWSQTLLYGARPTNPNFLSEKHPLRAPRAQAFFTDKMDAEQEALRFGQPGKGRIATVLRTAPILGPTVDSFLTRYLGHRLVPTVLGFDPLWQFLHEADAVAAFRLAVVRDAPGVFNVTGDGVLPLHTAIRLVGRTALPLPRLLTRYLGHRLVPTVLGFDPLWQFLHEADAVAAFRLAVVRDAPGVFNVTGDGVLPLHTAIRLVGRTALPLPRLLTRTMAGALWLAQLAEAPPSFCDYLQYICVADGTAAQKALGFRPSYTSREAVIEFGSAQRLRDVRLLSESPA